MFEPGTITYGFAKTISDPKNKYAISLFRDENVKVLIHFTTTRPRAGVPVEKIHHGINRDEDGNVKSYVFEPTVDMGILLKEEDSASRKERLCNLIMGFFTETIGVFNSSLIIWR